MNLFQLTDFLYMNCNFWENKTSKAILFQKQLAMCCLCTNSCQYDAVGGSCVAHYNVGFTVGPVSPQTKIRKSGARGLWCSATDDLLNLNFT